MPQLLIKLATTTAQDSYKMRLKRLRKAGDITYDQPMGAMSADDQLSAAQPDEGTTTATAADLSSMRQASPTCPGVDFILQSKNSCCGFVGCRAG